MTTRHRCCPSLTGAKLSENDAMDLAGVLKALADPVRLRLINIVASAGEACACDLPKLLGKSQPTVSHHLSLLTSAGVLHREQRGKWAWFKIDAKRLAEIRQALAGPAD